MQSPSHPQVQPMMNRWLLIASTAQNIQSQNINALSVEAQTTSQVSDTVKKSLLRIRTMTMGVIMIRDLIKIRSLEKRMVKVVITVVNRTICGKSAGLG